MSIWNHLFLSGEFRAQRVTGFQRPFFQHGRQIPAVTAAPGVVEQVASLARVQAFRRR